MHTRLSLHFHPALSTVELVVRPGDIEMAHLADTPKEDPTPKDVKEATKDAKKVTKTPDIDIEPRPSPRESKTKPMAMRNPSQLSQVISNARQEVMGGDNDLYLFGTDRSRKKSSHLEALPTI